MDNLGFVDDESCSYEDDSEERLLDFEEFQAVFLNPYRCFWIDNTIQNI